MGDFEICRKADAIVRLFRGAAAGRDIAADGDPIPRAWQSCRRRG
jgi:hypothetical protein